MRPILFLPFSVNQRLPSGPVVIRLGPLFAVGMVNSVNVPSVAIRPMRLPPFSANQSAPSGPA